MKKSIASFFSGLWRVFSFVSKALQILLFLIVVAFVLALFGQSPQLVTVPDSVALVVNPSGLLVDKLSGDPVTRALDELQGMPQRETLTRDVLAALEAAGDDDRVRAVVLDLTNFQGGGLPQLQELARGLQELRAQGKRLLATGDSYSQAQYYLASQADEIYMHEFGGVYIEGFGYFRSYFRDALEKLSVDVNVFRVGEYKSFVEPFTRDSMSQEDKDSSRRWLSALWDAYRDDVRVARALPENAIQEYVESFADRVEAAGGNLAEVALAAGLVDKLGGRDAIDGDLLDLVGESKQDEGQWSGIDHASYLSAIRREQPRPVHDNNVGVLVAAGQIIDGQGQPGSLGGDSFAALVRQAALDASIDALVLRVDSPGGSMFASEVILEALQNLRDSGKPLVASMGSVAASGGYYIAMPAERIFAEPTTITGSIGVGALMPTFQRTLERVGVSVDGIGTTRLSGQLSPDRALGDDARRVLQASVEDAYQIFIGKVAEYRGMDIERVDNLARGRVWIGSDAIGTGLVDEPGGLKAAIAAAAQTAGLPDGDWGVRYVEPELTWREQISSRLALRLGSWTERLGFGGIWRRNASINALLSEVGDKLARFSRFNDPRGLYFHCFCAVN